MLIVSTDKEEIQRLKDLLNKEFEMKYLGPVRKVMGMDITRNREKRTLEDTRKIMIIRKNIMINLQPYRCILAT